MLLNPKFLPASWSFVLFVFFVFFVFNSVQAQTTTSAPATTPSTQPRNIDKALEEEISFDIASGRLEDAIAQLRNTTLTNIAVNWPALAKAGVTRDTPVTVHLKNLPYEQVLRSLMQVIPAEKTRPNFLLGGNTVDISTTAELGKSPVVRIYNISRAAAATIDGAKPTPDQRAQHADFLRKVILKELANAGEEAGAPGRDIAVKNDNLVATQSKRGQLFVQWTIGLFENPTKLHQSAPATNLTAQAKKTETTLATLKLSMPALAQAAQNPLPDLNVIALPGTAAELAKPLPALDYNVTDGGVIEVAPAADLANHVTIGVYDLRDLLKHMAAKNKQKQGAPDNAELAQAVLTVLKEKVQPCRTKETGQWGDLEKSPSSLTLYEAFLVVFAQPAAHRAIAAGLEDMNKQ